MGRIHNIWSPSVSAVHSRFLTMNVTSNISHKITYNLPNAQKMRFTTLSKPQNTKTSASLYIITVNCCSWQSSYLYITEDLSNHVCNF